MMIVFWKIYKSIFKVLVKYLPVHQVRRNLLRAAGYKVGKDVYIGGDLIIIDELIDKGLVGLGNRVAIAERVTLVISSRPNFSRLSHLVSSKHGPIVIKDDAWLGTGVIVMPNITIGVGAVVGAGSVVTKDVPDFTVVAGNPAQIIRRIEPSRRQI
jgi:acetyltransferase-like isoleucine patch superfamily enzyme